MEKNVEDNVSGGSGKPSKRGHQDEGEQDNIKRSKSEVLEKEDKMEEAMEEHITDITSAADFTDQNEEYVDDWPNLGAGGGPTTRAMARENNKQEKEEKAKRGKGKIGEEETKIKWAMPFTNSPLMDGPSTKEGKMLSRINMYGLEEIPMSTDEKVPLKGNTQFCALAKLMFDTAMEHKYVRERATRELGEHPGIYERAFHEYHGEANYKGYCEEVSQVGKEGDDVSLQGASNAFQVKILLVCSSEDNFILEFIPENHTFNKELIMASFSDGNREVYKAIYDPKERRSTRP